MTVILSLIFFASGAAALLFETLWFRQAGLMLGNSVWATSLVTSSFMGGLAIGNAWAGARGGRWKWPLRAYAGLEAAIGVTGLGLVLLLPRLTSLMAPAFTPLLNHLPLLNGLRFGVAFLLLLVPATAMGATLPILARAISLSEPRFGRALGMLYGFNTLGAVCGALLGELVLIERFGLRGTGLCAAAINACAVVAALRLSRRADGKPVEASTQDAPPVDGALRQLLAAGFLAGGILLSLEVVWFRLLLLFVFGSSLSFAVMLAVVLFGIGAGGLLAGLLVRRDDEAWLWLPGVPLFAGAVTAFTYSALPDTLERYAAITVLSIPSNVLVVATALMLPTALLSGALFTLMGAAVKAQGHGASRAVGALAFSNTVGAMLGPLLTTFVLLPGLGIERTVFLLAAAYGIVALLCRAPRALRAEGSRGTVAAAGIAGLAYVALVALFPFGLMRNNFARRPALPYLGQGLHIEAYREGLTETVTYLVRDLGGEATSHRLLTNSFSMSGSTESSQRYMKFFVYLPVALHPAPKKALLISYGVGQTARALVETRSLESVDVVDISKDILEMGRIIFPETGVFPLDDPRVHVHVEDGRFFLLTTDQSYDIITAEPPPPKGSGIVNLYSSEYFDLIRKRLAPGGIATYWLPVYQMRVAESKSIIRGFCNVFPDCSLWSGVGLEWMLVGTRGFEGPISEDGLGRQWSDPVAGPAVRGLGFVSPELAGTTFIADARSLGDFTAGTPPLVDDHPLRISPHLVSRSDPLYFDFMNVSDTRARFESSEWIKRLWPAPLRDRTLAAFETQAQVNLADLQTYGGPAMTLEQIEMLLVHTSLRRPVLVAFQTSDAEITAARHSEARGESAPFLFELLAFDSLAARDYEKAAAYFLKAESGPLADAARAMRALCLGLAGRTAEARSLVEETSLPSAPQERLKWEWLAQRFGAGAKLSSPR